MGSDVISIIPSYKSSADKLSQYLISSEEECAEKVLYLLQHPDIAAELGREGKEHIRQNFLVPRLIKDELSLIRSLLQD